VRNVERKCEVGKKDYFSEIAAFEAAQDKDTKQCKRMLKSGKGKQTSKDCKYRKNSNENWDKKWQLKEGWEPLGKYNKRHRFMKFDKEVTNCKTTCDTTDVQACKQRTALF
jgi:hypothetical protein